MIKVGLTGNIGAGKSTVAKVFETLGVPVYHADVEAKKFLNYPDVIKELIVQFGSELFTKGEVDRKKLSSLVFSDSVLLGKLNAIIHPLVKSDLEDWIIRNEMHLYIIQEAAILFESGFYKKFDKVILVHSPLELAAQRVMKRDNVSFEEIERRRDNQWSQERKSKLSDYIIYNDEKQLIIPQVLRIHSRFMGV